VGQTLQAPARHPQRGFEVSIVKQDNEMRNCEQSKPTYSGPPLSLGFMNYFFFTKESVKRFTCNKVKRRPCESRLSMVDMNVSRMVTNKCSALVHMLICGGTEGFRQASQSTSEWQSERNTNCEAGENNSSFTLAAQGICEAVGSPRCSGTHHRVVDLRVATSPGRQLAVVLGLVLLGTRRG
jgi:hypothetical protein